MNILLLCPDELKATAMSLYGHRLDTTPFLESIAERAVVFDQCHTVHPKCVPSRCAFLSGQYPHVNGHRTLHLHARPHEINLIRTLRENGYETALVGKNHVVDADTMPGTFDYHQPSRGKVAMETPPNTLPPGSYWVGEHSFPLEEFTDYGETETALEWIENGRDSTKPFFMWVNWNAPHPPYGVPQPFHGMTDRSHIDLPPRDSLDNKPPYQAQLRESYELDKMTDDDWREVIGTYLDMTRFVDAEIERVFQRLEAQGILDDTMVVLWSDHGDFAGEHQLPEKWDTSFYDCITRVPLVIHAPHKLGPARIPALVESIDILPTLLSIVGVEVPKGVQGIDLNPLMRGEVNAVRDVVFCQGGQEPGLLELAVAPDAKPRPCVAYQMKQSALYAQPGINIRAKMIRDFDWKYCYHQSGFEELYDLQHDPCEIHNLAQDSDHSETRERYRMKMLNKLVEAETVEPYQDFLES